MPPTPEIRYALIQALTKGEPMPMQQARSLVRDYGEACYDQGRFHGDSLARIGAVQGSTHPYAGQSKERAEIGLPGHCERCAEVGHVKAHRSLGCGDVGCMKGHAE